MIGLVAEASDLARAMGIPNLLQAGLVKEMIIADILGHELIHSERGACARACGNPDETYKYLYCREDGASSGPGRMFKEPPDKRRESLTRIARNAKVYLAVFYADNQTKCKAIYELETDAVVAEAERRLDRSANSISHIGFSEHWARGNGELVYEGRLAAAAALFSARSCRRS